VKVTPKKVWKLLTEGWVGYITYALLGIALAYAINFFLGFLLHSDLPIVAVASSSMSHQPIDGMLCGKLVLSYRNSFDDWWNVCGETYKQFNISKEEFMQFPFSNGFNMGDAPIVKGDKAYKVGDIIVYSIKEEPIPIIHRIVAINPDGSYQTKGDHNPGQLPYEKSVQKEQIHGKVIGVLPYVGWVKVAFIKLIGV